MGPSSKKIEARAFTALLHCAPDRKARMCTCTSRFHVCFLPYKLLIMLTSIYFGVSHMRYKGQTSLQCKCLTADYSSVYSKNFGIFITRLSSMSRIKTSSFVTTFPPRPLPNRSHHIFRGPRCTLRGKGQNFQSEL